MVTYLSLLLTLAHVTLTISCHGRHSYEADMSGEMTNLDIPCDAPCALEFVPRLSLLTSSLTIVSLQANSAQCSTTRVGTVSIAGYRSRFSV